MLVKWEAYTSMAAEDSAKAASYEKAADIIDRVLARGGDIEMAKARILDCAAFYSRLAQEWAEMGTEAWQRGE